MCSSLDLKEQLPKHKSCNKTVVNTPQNEENTSNVKFNGEKVVNLACTGDVTTPTSPISIPYIHTFSKTFMNKAISGQIVVLDSSFYVWIGLPGADACMGNLVTSIKTRFECHDTLPIATSILSNSGDSVAKSISQKLTRRTGKMCFVSYNLTDIHGDGSSEMFVLKTLVEELKILELL